MMKKGILFLLILISCSLHSQQIRITGKITDSNNKPLDNVSVVQAGTAKGTFSDNAGNYKLEIAAKDSVRIIFSSIGYHEYEYILPSPIADVLLNIKMDESDTQLAQVTVEGRRTITTVIEHIDYLATRRASSPWGSIESLLATMGGVTINNELSSQYSVRGGNFDENIVYVNGIEIYRPLLVRSAQQEGLSFINPNMVQSVGFSAGGYSAEYGDKMSSVLDITYRKPKEFEASVAGSFLGGEAHIGNSSGCFSQITGIRYKTIRSLLSTTDTEAEYDPAFFDVQTFMTYDLSTKWQINFLGNYSHNTYKYVPRTRTTSFGTLQSVRNFTVHFNGQEKDQFITYQAALTLKGQLADNLNIGLTASAFSSDEQERYDITGRYVLRELNTSDDGNSTIDESSLLGIGTYMEHARNKVESDVYTLSHFGDYRINNNLIKWGLSYQKEDITDRIVEWQMRDSAGYSIPNTGTQVNMYSNLRSDNAINSSRFSGYLQDTYTLSTDKGLFIFNAGLRGSYWSFNKEFILSPRGAIAFVPQNVQNLSLRLAGGIYYQAPFYKEFQRIVNVDGNNVVELNKDIKSQKSIHIVLGADYYFKGRMDDTPPFKLSGELYYKRLSDLIPYTVNNVKIRYSGENMAKGYITGVDFKLYGEFIPGADSWISLGLMKAQQEIDGIKTPMPSDQRFNFALFFQDYFPGYERVRMSLRGLWSQGLPTSAPYMGYENGYFRTPAYKRFDIGFSWQVLGEDFAIRNTSSFCKAFRNVWLGLDVFNLFDMQNTNTYYWVSDVYNNKYAVPNYLTGRQLNVKLIAEF